MYIIYKKDKRKDNNMFVINYNKLILKTRT